MGWLYLYFVMDMWLITNAMRRFGDWYQIDKLATNISFFKLSDCDMCLTCIVSFRVLSSYCEVCMTQVQSL